MCDLAVSASVYTQHIGHDDRTMQSSYCRYHQDLKQTYPHANTQCSNFTIIPQW